MIHDIDYATWLCGQPRGVHSHIMNGQPGQCAVVGVLDYADCFVEVTGVSMMPMSSPFAVGYEAIFEKAVIQYREDSFKDREVSSLEVFTAEGVENVELPRQNCYEMAIRQVVDCILHDTEPVNGIEAAGVSLAAALDMHYNSNIVSNNV
jgi:predicted dehydrogenase